MVVGLAYSNRLRFRIISKYTESDSVVAGAASTRPQCVFLADQQVQIHEWPDRPPSVLRACRFPPARRSIAVIPSRGERIPPLVASRRSARYNRQYVRNRMKVVALERHVVAHLVADEYAVAYSLDHVPMGG